MPYHDVLDQAVDDILATLSRRDGRGLRDFFRFLAEHPFTAGEQRVTDGDGVPARRRRMIGLWSPAGRNMRLKKFESSR